MSEVIFKIQIPDNLETILQALLDGQAAPAPIEKEVFWTINDICRAFQLKKSKVYSLTMQTGPGSLPRFKVGRELRFNKSEVLDWVNQQKVETGEV